jgi:hypothetical protein
VNILECFAELLKATAPVPPGMLTLKEFAARIGVKYGTVKRWAGEGMPVFRRVNPAGNPLVRVDFRAAKSWVDARQLRPGRGPRVAVKRSSEVYFAHDKRRSMIKIGFSSDPERRVRELRRASDGGHIVKLIGTMPGDKVTELRVHGMFSHLRIETEWFRAAPELFEFIESLRKAVA